jgi:hypothetical protein
MQHQRDFIHTQLVLSLQQIAWRKVTRKDATPPSSLGSGMKASTARTRRARAHATADTPHSC